MDSLGSREAAALREALDDEYRAFATYDRVIKDFGPVRPFINIRAAEARHIAALTVLFSRYGLPMPPNKWQGKVTGYADLRAACEAGVAAEIENRALYERLLEDVQHADIRRVFLRLQEASQERHLPAFRRCLSRRGGGSARAGGSKETGEPKLSAAPRRRLRRRFRAHGNMN